MRKIKKLLIEAPIIGFLVRYIYGKWFYHPKTFPGSADYWRQNYASGGNSGEGSYGRLAEFKAEILNNFIKQEHIESIIEYGCGDGNQLKLAHYPAYIGFDVSSEAIVLCRKAFSHDKTKSFKPADEYENETAQLTLSLDVLYHLIEDAIFENYMHRLFDSSLLYVIIYSSNTQLNSENQMAHVKHREFTNWVRAHKKEWQLLKHIPNRYPLRNGNKDGSFSDFFIFKKK